MAEKKSLVEETLLQMKSLEDVISENAKGILHSTMKEEIGELVKESLKEAEEDTDMETDTEVDMDSEMEPETDMDMDTDVDTDMEGDEDTVDLRGMSFREVADIISNMDDNDKIVVVKDEDQESEDFEDTEDEESDEEDEESENITESMMDDEMDDDFETLDLDNSHSMHHSHGFEDEESDEDEFSDFEDDEDEEEMEFDESWSNEEEDEESEGVVYEIEMDEEEEDESMEMDEEESDETMEMDEEESEETMEMDEEEDDESMEMDEEENLEEGFKAKGVGMGKPKFKYDSKPNQNVKTKKMKQGPKSVGTGKAKFEYKEGSKMKMKQVKSKGETTEASRTLGSGRRFGRKGLPKPKAAPRHLNVESVNNEINLLREKNEEYRKALNVFRTKLNEVAVFNSNLAYATRLFTEHSTTKQEKINILRRFDSVESIKESKSLYKTIKEELSSQAGTAIVKESLQEKIEKTPQSGSAANLIESKTYENPQFMRMKDLMSKINIIK